MPRSHPIGIVCTQRGEHLATGGEQARARIRRDDKKLRPSCCDHGKSPRSSPCLKAYRDGGGVRIIDEEHHIITAVSHGGEVVVRQPRVRHQGIGPGRKGCRIVSREEIRLHGLVCDDTSPLKDVRRGDDVLPLVQHHGLLKGAVVVRVNLDGRVVLRRHDVQENIREQSPHPCGPRRVRTHRGGVVRAKVAGIANLHRAGNYRTGRERNLRTGDGNGLARTDHVPSVEKDIRGNARERDGVAQRDDLAGIDGRIRSHCGPGGRSVGRIAVAPDLRPRGSRGLTWHGEVGFVAILPLIIIDDRVVLRGGDRDDAVHAPGSVHGGIDRLHRGKHRLLGNGNVEELHGRRCKQPGPQLLRGRTHRHRGLDGPGLRFQYPVSAE